MRRQTGSARAHAPNPHPLGADLTEDTERSIDVGDARLGQLLVAQRIRCPERHHQSAMLDEQVVQFADELFRELLLAGRLRVHRPPRLAEVVNEARERHDECLSEERGFRTEVPKEQVLGHAGRLGDLPRGGAAVVLLGEQATSGVEQESPRLTPRPPS